MFETISKLSKYFYCAYSQYCENVTGTLDSIDLQNSCYLEKLNTLSLLCQYVKDMGNYSFLACNLLFLFWLLNQNNFFFYLNQLKRKIYLLMIFSCLGLMSIALFRIINVNISIYLFGKLCISHHFDLFLLQLGIQNVIAIMYQLHISLAY